MFFDKLLLPADALGGPKKKAAIRALPPIHGNWVPPREFPNLANATAIAIDTETYDPELNERGPGWARGKGHIVGISIAATDALNNRGKWYFPMRHEVQSELNLDPAHVLRWANDALSGQQPKLGANLLYDYGWLTQEGVTVNGQLHDVQFAEAILNEAGEVNLEHLAQKYLGEGKESNALYEWLALAYGGKPGPHQRANLYRSPPQLAGPYAEQDAALLFDILSRQWTLLQSEGLERVYRMECDLIRLLVKMRFAGVTVDLDKAVKLYDRLGVEIPLLYNKLQADTGVAIESVDSGTQLAKVFDAAGVKYPLTEAGAPSFQKKWLEALEHPIGKQVINIREHQKIRGTFIESYILKSNVNGKIYCSFHPLRGDDGGTRSGRFASSDPNLQNIPVRTELGKLIREIFIADHGHFCWRKQDYSQIEYRFLAHFAVGEGADAVRHAFCSDPDTDYHKLVQALVLAMTGIEIARKPIKNINFGLLYGMGEDKLARQIGVAKAAAKDIFNAYHKGAPYVRSTMDEAARQAQDYGYVETIMGRRSRFDLWEPVEVNYGDRAMALPYELALRQYGSSIQRAHTHKAINRRLQGSAADMMKLAMWECDRQGVFDYTGVPRLTIHDELDHSVTENTPQMRQAYEYMESVMENCMPLRVPVKVESGNGLNWGAID